MAPSVCQEVIKVNYLVIRRIQDPVLSAKFSYLHPGFGFFEPPDNQLFSETLLHYCPV